MIHILELSELSDYSGGQYNNTKPVHVNINNILFFSKGEHTNGYDSEDKMAYTKIVFDTCHLMVKESIEEIYGAVNG